MRYYWRYEEPGWIDKLHEYDISKGEWYDFWKQHMGSSDDFCEYFEEVVKIAQEHYPPVIVDAIKKLLPALEAGDIKRVTVGSLWLEVGEGVAE